VPRSGGACTIALAIRTDNSARSVQAQKAQKAQKVLMVSPPVHRAGTQERETNMGTAHRLWARVADYFGMPEE
jgi:hypothetical protein